MTLLNNTAIQELKFIFTNLKKSNSGNLELDLIIDRFIKLTFIKAAITKQDRIQLNNNLKDVETHAKFKFFHVTPIMPESFPVNNEPDFDCMRRLVKDMKYDDAINLINELEEPWKFWYYVQPEKHNKIRQDFLTIRNEIDILFSEISIEQDLEQYSQILHMLSNNLI
jgi:hypothetical protein